MTYYATMADLRDDYVKRSIDPIAFEGIDVEAIASDLWHSLEYVQGRGVNPEQMDAVDYWAIIEKHDSMIVNG